MLIDHDAAEGLKEPHRAFDIEIDDAVEVLAGVVENRLADVQPRRGHRNIEAWKFLHHAGRERRDVGGIGCVAGRAVGRSSQRANAGRGRVRALAIGAHHAGAERRRRFGGRLADAGGRAKHDRCLPGEIEELAIVRHSQIP